jgi:hypothetical protein
MGRAQQITINLNTDQDLITKINEPAEQVLAFTHDKYLFFPITPIWQLDFGRA